MNRERVVGLMLIFAVAMVIFFAGYLIGSFQGANEAADLIDENFVCQPKK